MKHMLTYPVEAGKKGGKCAALGFCLAAYLEASVAGAIVYSTTDSFYAGIGTGIFWKVCRLGQYSYGLWKNYNLNPPE